MKRPKIRIFHIEDEWEEWRFLPHQLFDRLFDFLDPQQRVNLELEEEYGAAGSQIPFSFRALDSGAESAPIFTYSFFEDAKQMAMSNPAPTDLVIIDVMSSDDSGNLKPNVDQTLALISKLNVPIERCRYFSAYPGEFPVGVDCKGYSKGDVEQLIGFLFGEMKKVLLEKS